MRGQHADQKELLLQEIAVLRGEVAHLHMVLESSDESLHKLIATVLERLGTLVPLKQIEARLSLLPQ